MPVHLKNRHTWLGMGRPSLRMRWLPRVLCVRAPLWLCCIARDFASTVYVALSVSWGLSGFVVLVEAGYCARVPGTSFPAFFFGSRL